MSDEGREDQAQSRVARLEAALGACGIGVWEWHVRTEALVWDARARAVLDAGVDEEVGPDAFLALVHPDDRARVKAAVADALTRGGAHSVTFRVVTPSGRMLFLSAHAECTFDAGGVPEVLFGTLRDVSREETLRGKAAAAARRAESNARLVRRLASIEGTDEAIRILCDETAAALGVDTVLVRVVDERTKSTTTGGIHGAPEGFDPRAADPAEREAFFTRHGAMAQFEDIGDVPDTPDHARLVALGIRFVAYARLLVDHETGGILIACAYERRVLDDEEMRFFAAAADVLSGALARGRLAARHREIVATMSQCVVLVDSLGNISFVNPAVESFLGRTARELVGARCTTLWRDEDRAAREARYRSVVERGGAHRELVRYAPRDGRETWGIESIVPFRDPTIHAGALILITDVTETRRMDAALSEAQRLESLGVLAGGIAHDFNNLLAVILGNATLVVEQTLDSGIVASVRDIEQAALRGSELTRQLLAYAGKGRFVVTRNDVNELVEGMARLISATVPKSIARRFALAPEPLLVDGDATQLRQVVLNLFTNAADAIGGGSGTITVRTDVVELDAVGAARIARGEALALGRYVVLEISDTGGGMSEETRVRVFEPFFSTKQTGRGLGLAAVLGILRSHGGAIEVESALGKGSTFRVLLPRASVPSVGKEPSRPPGPLEGPREGPLVLVADDEGSVRRMMKRVLERGGFRVLEAEDGAEAVELFAAHRDEIALVVLDSMMPRVSGAEAFAQLRAIAPGLRVLLASGYTEEDATKLFGDGLDGFVMKPFTPAVLLERVRATLDAR